MQQYGIRLRKEWANRKFLYLMALPVIAYFIIFKYIPIYGVIIAFKSFNPNLGILGSPWVGFKHFESFFNSFYLGRLFTNTLLLSLYNIIFGFPAPIILALLLNEVKFSKFKKVIQSITYMPNFISLVVICGIVKDFVSRNGVITDLFFALGVPRSNMLLNAGLFRTIYVASGIWQSVGFGSIIYLAAMSNVDAELYEAAAIDGVTSRFRRAVHITLPCIAPTIIILFILQIGNLMNVGFEKVLLLYNNSILSTADIISTYVYRKGLLEFNYSYSSAVGLFNSVLNCGLLFGANWMSKRFTEVSLW